MKTITLRRHRRDKEDWDDRQLLKAILERPQQGLDVGEMRIAIKILDKIDACDGTKLELEDAEFTLLRERFRTHRFGLAEHGVVLLADAIEAAAAAN